MAKTCSTCGGTGTIPSHLQPYGFKRNAGMGMDVCKSCNGTGKVRGPADDENADASQRPKTLRVVWFFGLTAAFFAGILKPLPTDWFINSVLGFVVFGAIAGFMWERVPYGRLILAIVGLLILSLFGFAIYRAETGQLNQ